MKNSDPQLSALLLLWTKVSARLWSPGRAGRSLEILLGLTLYKLEMNSIFISYYKLLNDT